MNSASKIKAYAVWMSDLHFGIKASKTNLLIEFLKALDKDVLQYVFLNGDIFDFWVFNSWDSDIFHVVRILAKMAEKGVKIVYTPGNHDEDLRNHLPVVLGNFSIVDEYIYTRFDGQKILVLHGDKFDSVLYRIPFIAHLGSKIYDVLLWSNEKLHWFRRRLGLPYWSLSAYLKRKTKSAQGVLQDFNQAAVSYAKHRGCSGVMVGHVHTAEIKEYSKGFYYNSGDWVESCTAIIESEEGEMQIIDWSTMRMTYQKEATSCK